jgi:hypothetical protein
VIMAIDRLSAAIDTLDRIVSDSIGEYVIVHQSDPRRDYTETIRAGSPEEARAKLRERLDGRYRVVRASRPY